MTTKDFYLGVIYILSGDTLPIEKGIISFHNPTPAHSLPRVQIPPPHPAATAFASADPDTDTATPAAAPAVSDTLQAATP